LSLKPESFQDCQNWKNIENRGKVEKNNVEKNKRRMR
jgi:hypothetical protein